MKFRESKKKNLELTQKPQKSWSLNISSKMNDNLLGVESRGADELGLILRLLLKDKLFLSYNLHKRHVHAHSSKPQL